MSTTERDWKEILSKLTGPFADQEVEWRVLRGGLKKDGKPWLHVSPYVDARTIMKRLDFAVGAFNWEDDIVITEAGALCKLTIFGQTKVDGSEFTGIEGFKGSISKALVRTAAKWGIGRYLYETPPVFAQCNLKGQKGWEAAPITLKDKRKIMIYWVKPMLSKVVK